MIALFRQCDLAFFVYGFAKSYRQNLRRDELATFRRLARVLGARPVGYCSGTGGRSDNRGEMRWSSNIRVKR